MSIREQDFYKLLGIERNATFDEIKRAYRGKALSAHSDRTGSCDDELMKQLNIAYEKLSDLSSREDYDESLDLFHEEAERRAEEVAGYITTDQFCFSKQYRQRFIELSAKYLHDTAACIPYSRCYKPFISNLYITRERPTPTFTHDIFSFIKLKEAERPSSQIRANWSQPLDLKRAIELFTAFLQGDYLGDDLERLGDYFKAEITKLKVQVGEQDKSYLLLYKAMFNIINLTHEEPISINVLLKSTAALTRAAVNIYLKTRDSSHLTLLFANKYFRNLCAYALHLSWTTTDSAVINADLLAFNNVEIAKEALQKLKEEYKEHRGQPDYRKILIRQARSVRLLCRFAEDIDEKLKEGGEKPEAEFYREIAFHLLDWLPSLFEIPSKKTVANILLQIGLYFKKASLSPGTKNIKMADEELALSMFFMAIHISERAGADVELQVKSLVLKYFNIFEFGNEVLKKIIPLLQSKVLYLANIFPFLPNAKSNVNFVLHDHEYVWFLRNFLHHLVAIVKVRGADSTSDIDHEYVTVLYQAYEACLRHWYMQEHEQNVVTARGIKLELMQELLAKKWLDDR